MRFSIDLIVHHKEGPEVINNDAVTQLSSSSQTNHDKQEDSPSSNNFLNELSRKFRSNGTALLIEITDDIGPTSDLLLASDKGKLEDSCHLNDSMNDVSTNLDDHQESLRTVTHSDIAVCSNRESSPETSNATTAQLIMAEFNCHEANPRGSQFIWTIIAAENDSRDESSRLNLIVMRDNSEENKMSWKIIATEIDAAEQIKASFH
jgi:hypothetical protein